MSSSLTFGASSIKAAADHAKRIRRVETARGRRLGHGLLAGDSTPSVDRLFCCISALATLSLACLVGSKTARNPLDAQGTIYNLLELVLGGEGRMSDQGNSGADAHHPAPAPHTGELLHPASSILHHAYDFLPRPVAVALGLVVTILLLVNLIIQVGPTVSEKLETFFQGQASCDRRLSEQFTHAAALVDFKKFENDSESYEEPLIDDFKKIYDDYGIIARHACLESNTRPQRSDYLPPMTVVISAAIKKNSIGFGFNSPLMEPMQKSYELGDFLKHNVVFSSVNEYLLRLYEKRSDDPALNKGQLFYLDAQLRRNLDIPSLEQPQKCRLIATRSAVHLKLEEWTAIQSDVDNATQQKDCQTSGLYRNEAIACEKMSKLDCLHPPTKKLSVIKGDPVQRAIAQAKAAHLLLQIYDAKGDVEALTDAKNLSEEALMVAALPFDSYRDAHATHTRAFKLSTEVKSHSNQDARSNTGTSGQSPANDSQSNAATNASLPTIGSDSGSTTNRAPATTPGLTNPHSGLKKHGPRTQAH